MKAPKKISQIVIFEQLWIHSDKKSFVSGVDLKKYMGGKLELNLFAHVLSKKKYPYFRLYIGGIRLLSPYEHFLIDQGVERKRENYKQIMRESFVTVDWDKWFQEEEKLKELYEEKFPDEKYGMIMKYSEEEVWGIVKEMNDEWLVDNRI